MSTSKTTKFDPLWKSINFNFRLLDANWIRREIGLPPITIEEARKIEKAGEYHGA